MLPQPPFLHLESDGEIIEAQYDEHEKVSMTVGISTSLGNLPVNFSLDLIELGTLKYMTHLYPTDLVDKAIIVNDNVARRLLAGNVLPHTSILVQKDDYTLECYKVYNSEKDEEQKLQTQKKRLKKNER